MEAKEYPIETYLPLDVQMWLCKELVPGEQVALFATISVCLFGIALTSILWMFGNGMDAIER